MNKEKTPEILTGSNSNVEKADEIYNEKDQETLEIVKEKTRELLEDLSEYHGWGHTELVAHYAKIVALGEGADVFNAEMGGWTHDWGRAIEKIEGKTKPHAVLSGEISKDFYRELWEQKKLTTKQYGDIQRAVRRHSSMRETDRESLKIVRDADRLSRYDPLGFYQNVYGVFVEEGRPFYLDGQPIIRPADAPMMERKDVKCVIDDLNFCLDWQKIAENDSTKRLMEKEKNTFISFFELFSHHKDLTDGQLWVDFLKKHADEFKEKKEDFEKSYSWSGTENDLEEWLKFYEQIIPKGIYSEEKFQDFLKN